jgi:hypothetical protein
VHDDPTRHPAAPLAEPGPELADKNLHVLAERLHWPDGAIDGIKQIEAACPGWFAWFGDDGHGRARLLPRRGYGASQRDVPLARKVTVTGDTPAEVITGVREHEAAQRRAEPWRHHQPE